MRRSFPGIGLGIGDKISDALAYHGNGLRAYLIIDTEGEDGDDLEEMADELSVLPDEVQVVTGWDQIARGIFEGASYPRSAMQRALRRRAAGEGRR